MFSNLVRLAVIGDVVAYAENVIPAAAKSPNPIVLILMKTGGVKALVPTTTAGGGVGRGEAPRRGYSRCHEVQDRPEVRFCSRSPCILKRPQALKTHNFAHKDT